VPGIDVIVAGVALVGSGAGIHRTIGLIKDQLHVVAGAVHIGLERELD